MPFDPQESRQAHPETRLAESVAASLFPPLARSPAPGMRDSHPTAGRGAAAGQHSQIGRMGAMPIPASRALSRREIDLIFGEWARPVALPKLWRPASWPEIAIGALSVLALWCFLMALDWGWLG